MDSSWIMAALWMPGSEWRRDVLLTGLTQKHGIPRQIYIPRDSNPEKSELTKAQGHIPVPVLTDL